MPPGEPPVLAVDHERELVIAYARRTGHGFRAGMMRVVAEDDRFPLARPGALQIGDAVLCVRGRHAAHERQCNRKMSDLHFPLPFSRSSDWLTHEPRGGLHARRMPSKVEGR